MTNWITTNQLINEYCTCGCWCIFFVNQLERASQATVSKRIHVCTWALRMYCKRIFFEKLNKNCLNGLLAINDWLEG